MASRPRAHRPAASALLIALAVLITLAAAGCATARPAPRAVPVPPSRCRVLYGAPCYEPQQINHAYRLDDLHRAGVTGTGRTIAVITTFHNPRLPADLEVYSQRFGLPPARLEVIRQGAPAADPRDVNQAAWAQETSVDVQTVHASAPGARIVVLETRPAEPGPLALIPAAAHGVGWLAAHRPDIDVISMSWGEPEDNWAPTAAAPRDYRRLIELRAPLKAAHARRITLVASTGDLGPTGPTSTDTLSPHATVCWPASDPLVTAVGGTRLYLDDQGNRLRPDELWSDEGGAASGAGTSRVFARPPYQPPGPARFPLRYPAPGQPTPPARPARPAQKAAADGGRGVPDIALNASTRSREWHYTTGYQALPGQQSGWVLVAGTSLAAPRLAGIAALADQHARRRLGDINPALYATLPHPATAGLTDLTTGTTTANGVPGPTAGPGYDAASGVGTLASAPALLTALGRPHPPESRWETP